MVDALPKPLIALHHLLCPKLLRPVEKGSLLVLVCVGKLALWLWLAPRHSASPSCNGLRMCKDKESRDSMQQRRTCTSKHWNQIKLRSSNCKKQLRSEMRPFKCFHTWYKCIWTWTMLQFYAAQTGPQHSIMGWRRP